MSETTEIDAELAARLRRRLDELPVLPAVVARVMALDRRAENHRELVVEVVESDPNYAARLLAVANSAAGAPRQPMTTVSEAVRRIGSDGSVAALTAMGVCRVFVPRDEWERSLWRHSFQIAEGCRRLAAAAGWSAELVAQAHTAGLVHDVGRFVLFQEAPDVLRRIDEGSWATPEDLIDEERAVCGLTHTEVAARACSQWGLPQVITLVAALHHDRDLPDKLPPPVTELIRLVRFVDMALFPSALPGANEDRLDLRTVEVQLVPRLPDFITLDGVGLQEVARRSLDAAAATSEIVGLGS